METIAAIDIGSNAIRLVIGEVDSHGDVRVLKKVREPVRLGKDAFSSGEISPKTRDKALDAFRKFSGILKDHGVERLRAVATSALREARDREDFIQDVRRETGIRIDLIDGIEEGRLIYSAVAHKVPLDDKASLLIDIGGGSVELTVVDHGHMRGSETFKIGTVRMLEALEARGLKEKFLPEVIADHIGPARQFLARELKNLHIDVAIGTGGNFETLGKLRVALLQKNSIFSMTRHELEELVQHLESMTVKERIQFLRLREDRADVVIPAALVTLAVMRIADTEVLYIPYVGLRDGLLQELGQRRKLKVMR